jgi:hypothetical protein
MNSVNFNFFRFRLICAQLDKYSEVAHQKQEYLNAVQELVQLTSNVESDAGTSVGISNKIQPLVI